MSNITFEDNSMKVLAAIEDAALNFLEESGALIESQTKRNTRVDTGQTKGKWTHVVDESKKEVTIGNPLENSIWEELGTGEYAINGNGRKTPWKYKHHKYGWITTKGKKPTRALQHALDSCKAKINKQAESIFGSKLK